MKRTILFSIILAVFASFIMAGTQSPFMRYPAINNDGTKIAFSYQGDIWTVPSTGGRAFRLTLHEGYERNPVFSPDGRKIVFSSSRFGNNDIFIINTDGGKPERVTWSSSSDLVSCWGKDGNIIFESSRNYRQVEWESELLSVSHKGGTPTLLMNSLGSGAVASQDGKYIAYVKGSCRIAREAYKGSANRDIWIYDIKNKKYSQITTYEGQDFFPIWDNNKLYFISARSGRYNIYSVNINSNGKVSGKPEAITDFKDDPVTWISVSGNGDIIAFEKGTGIYTINKKGSNLKKLNVQTGSDYRFDPLERKTFTSKATEYKVSPDGKLIALVVRGEIFVTENKDKKSLTFNLTKHSGRDQNVAWLNDNSIIFSSDRGGNFDLYLVRSSDTKEKNIFRSLKHETIKLTDDKDEEVEPVVSPDGKKIVFLRGNGKLISADINKEGKIAGEKMLLNGWATPYGLTFSPDSKWLSYTLEDLNFNAEIFIHDVDNKKGPVNVSMHPRGDYSPFWSPDGSKLGFISARNNSSADIWFVWLNKKEWQKTKQEWDEESDRLYSDYFDGTKKDKKKDEDSDKKDKKKKKQKPLKIDFERIYERVVQVTRLPGDEGGIVISKDGKKFFFTAGTPGVRGRDLFSINWDGKKVKQLSKGGKNPSSLSLDKSGKNVYFIAKRGTISRADAKSGKIKSLPFKGKMVVDYYAELGQIFDEAWRMLRDNFYDPQFHGQDFLKLKEKYRNMCLSASTNQDFSYMYNMMLGQLNASHMGLYGSGRETTQKERTGNLGIRIKPLNEGAEVTYVIPDSPADRGISRLFKGDIILSINGENINRNMNFFSLLSDTAGAKTLLKVKNDKGKIREVVIRPTASLRREQYNDWVRGRRELTEKYSGGKLGYLHIQGMSLPSFERFERELASAGYGKEGIVIDVRFNGGGWTTDYLMAILNVKQHSYTIPRGAVKSLKEHKKFRSFYPFAERLPFYAWNKPSVAICNESSYSNAEIFSHAYKTLGIGTLVGQPTFGAVISTGGKGLINGMFVRKPFRAWYVKATDQNMEWEPAVPDVLIKNSPDFRSKGVDEQLKKACEVLLEQITKNPVN
ncbi:MAG: S41 family peptidase [Acidobacteriota bacterium]